MTAPLTTAQQFGRLRKELMTEGIPLDSANTIVTELLLTLARAGDLPIIIAEAK